MCLWSYPAGPPAGLPAASESRCQAVQGRWRLGEGGVLELNAPLLYTAQIVDGQRLDRAPGTWFRTRDVFRQEKGRWFMEAREGDLIIGANGENLSPDLIEQRLELSGVFCVTGMELDGGERPVLLVQTGQDAYAQASAAEAAFAAVERLPLTLRPARIFLTCQTLPISLGKVRRVELRQQLQKGTLSLTPAVRPAREELEALEDDSPPGADSGAVRPVYRADRRPGGAGHPCAERPGH